MKPIFSNVSFFRQPTLTPLRQKFTRNIQKKTQPTEHLQNSFGFDHKLFGLECCFSTNFYEQSQIEDLKFIWSHRPNTNQKFSTMKITPQPRSKSRSQLNKPEKHPKYQEGLRNDDYETNDQFDSFKENYFNSPTKRNRRDLHPKLHHSNQSQNNMIKNQNKKNDNKNKNMNKTNTRKNPQSPNREKISSVASRSLYLGNLNQEISEQELLSKFKKFGDLQSIRVESDHSIISYFDIRDAKEAKKQLQGSILQGNVLDLSYINPNKNGSKNINQGTLVVFGLNEFISNKELEMKFSQYGQVREIRSTPNKVYHRFVEFYDIREAEIAMNNLNKTKIKTRRIKIELARVVPIKRKKKNYHYQNETTNNNDNDNDNNDNNNYNTNNNYYNNSNNSKNTKQNQNQNNTNVNLTINNSHNHNFNDKQDLNYYSNPNSYSNEYSKNIDNKNYNYDENNHINVYQNNYNYESNQQFLNSNSTSNNKMIYYETNNQYFYQNEENNKNIELSQFEYQEGFDYYNSNNSYDYYIQENF
ncbi:protein mei2-like 4 [Anaeramoeba flamelloides]|uniref:Protein mei2-like 4 n=1 Tax=Anaeramoeba flamelloides TaxID=1746091 RepID=A0ABQ8YAE1_9EUKA|nr:protein mei2-like 4 [Anaeramoeba flamelloides]